MSKTIAIATVYDNTELIPHFVKHYHELGVDLIALNVTTANGDQLFAQVREAVRGVPVILTRVCHPVFNEVTRNQDEQRLLEPYANLDDWILHLDIDEFHEYPIPLREVTAHLEAKGLSLIQTEIVDRVAIDGTFPAISPLSSIFSQFPLGCSITRHWMGQPYMKVMICRRWVQLVEGRHHATNAANTRSSAGPWWKYRVHHFRWSAGVIDRLRRRVEVETELVESYRRACRRILRRFLRAKIDVRQLPSLEYCGEYQDSHAERYTAARATRLLSGRARPYRRHRQELLFQK